MPRPVVFVFSRDAAQETAEKMQLQVPIAGGAALHRRGAVAMVRRNLSDKNVAFIVS